MISLIGGIFLRADILLRLTCYSAAHILIHPPATPVKGEVGELMKQQNTEQPKSEIANLTSPVPTRDLPPATANPDTTCLVCEKPHSFRWTDTHGVGACWECGAPHTIFHYEGDKRLDKAPAIALNDLGLVLAKRYWAEQKSMVFPGSYDMGFSGHGGATYSGATEADMNAWSEWMEKQPEVIAHAAREAEPVEGSSTPVRPTDKQEVLPSSSESSESA